MLNSYCLSNTILLFKNIIQMANQEEREAARLATAMDPKARYKISQRISALRKNILNYEYFLMSWV